MTRVSSDFRRMVRDGRYGWALYLLHDRGGRVYPEFVTMVFDVDEAQRWLATPARLPTL